MPLNIALEQNPVENDSFYKIITLHGNKYSVCTLINNKVLIVKAGTCKTVSMDIIHSGLYYTLCRR